MMALSSFNYTSTPSCIRRLLQVTMAGQKYMPDDLPVLFAHEQHWFSENLQRQCDWDAVWTSNSKECWLHAEECMWNSDKAFWTQDWVVGIFCSLIWTFRWCLLLPPDVQHLLHGKVMGWWAATKWYKNVGRSETVMVHSFCMLGIRQQHAYQHMYMCIPAHAELNGNEEQQAAMARHQALIWSEPWIH